MYQQKKLKLIVSSLKQKDLIQFFQLYSGYYVQDIKKNIKKISFNCYETTIEHRNITVNGYGKNYNDAFASGISNFMEKALEDEKYHNSVRECIKKFTTNSNESTSNQKIKTQPDIHHERKVSTYSKPMQNSLKPKENIMKSVKTIKEEIFESLNHENIQLKPTLQSKGSHLNKNSSYSVLHNLGQQNNGSKNEELELVVRKIKELQQQLAEANQQNEHLRIRLKEKERYSESAVPQAVIEKRSNQMKTLQNDSYLKDISSKFNNTSTPNEIKHEPEKLRSYSLSNSVNSSAFNSRVPPKIRIPKLNLEILPNYHGKSNKSLNQSLLESYEKKAKGTSYNV